MNPIQEVTVGITFGVQLEAVVHQPTRNDVFPGCKPMMCF